MFAALIILALHIPSVHTAMGGAAARAPTRAPGYPIEEGAYSGFLPGLEYRPWRHGDLFGGEQLPMTYGRRFVAAVPNSEYVLGYVESEEDKPAPAYLWDELQGMTERDTVVYISCVIVHSYVQNKRIASTMLPKALDDIRVRWPTVIATHLVADRTNPAVTRLYSRLNFTVVDRLPQYAPFFLSGRVFVCCPLIIRRSPKVVVNLVSSLREPPEPLSTLQVPSAQC